MASLEELEARVRGMERQMDLIHRVYPATVIGVAPVSGIATYYDYDTAVQSTASTSWTATTVSVSVTLAKAGLIQITSSFIMKATYANYPGFCAAFVDTTEVGAEQTTGATTDWSAPKSSPGSLYVAAGTYTVALKFISPTPSKEVSIDNAYLTAMVWEE